MSEYDKEYFKDKMFFMWGKKGHPKSACKAKMTKDDSSTWSSKSSMSSALSSKKKSKIMLTISKGFKTMGKAMSQIHKEELDISSNESSMEHSHAQSGRMQGERHSFATSRFTLKHQLLLDSQSSDHVFFNLEYVIDIRGAAWQLQLKQRWKVAYWKNCKL